MRFCVLLVLFAFTGCSSLLYHGTHKKYFDPEKHGLHQEDVTFASLDGTKIHAWYFKSKKAEKPRAQFVFFHGNGENLTSHFATLAWILPFGYDYLIFDYRGYGKSEGTPTPQGTVEDGEAAIRYLYHRNPKIPLIVFAQSLGGAVAIRSIVELHGQIPIKWVVLDSTFVSYEAEGRSLLSKSWVTWLFQPLADVLLSDSWAPGDQIAQISPIPILVMHGDRDRTVDYNLGLDLFKRAREPKEFWRIKDGVHTDAFWRHGGIYRVKFLKKLDEILKSN